MFEETKNAGKCKKTGKKPEPAPSGTGAEVLGRHRRPAVAQLETTFWSSIIGAGEKGRGKL